MKGWDNNETKGTEVFTFSTDLESTCAFLSEKLLQEKCFLGQKTSLLGNDLALGWLTTRGVFCKQSCLLSPGQGTWGHFTPVLFPILCPACLFCSEPSQGQAQVRLSFIRHSTSCFNTHHLSLSVQRGKYFLLPTEDFF